jgi:DnaD/phage-associated family protein
MTFPGFSEQLTTQIHIPEQFFRDLLPQIDNLQELKLTLYIFWQLERKEGLFRYLYLSDLLKDKPLLKSMGKDLKTARANLVEVLGEAAGRGSLILTDYPMDKKNERLIFLNTPKGRAALEGIKRGDWHIPGNSQQPPATHTEHLNIFQLYETNVGPLTPLIADALRDAEKTYQANWIEDAFRIAVERNKRSWHYIEAILHRWQEGGRDDRKDKQNRRDTEKTRRRYSDWEK